VEPVALALVRRPVKKVVFRGMGEPAHKLREARSTDYPIQYQWTLLHGINDGDDEVEGLAGCGEQLRPAAGKSAGTRSANRTHSRTGLNAAPGVCAPQCSVIGHEVVLTRTVAARGS
jgi:hypothetical protein